MNVTYEKSMALVTIQNKLFILSHKIWKKIFILKNKMIFKDKV